MSPPAPSLGRMAPSPGRMALGLRGALAAGWIAAGFAAFGGYALARARYPDRDPSS